MDLEQHLSPLLTGEVAHQQRPQVGLVAMATYLPEQVQDAAFIAAQSGIPEDIVRQKLGIQEKRRAGPADQTSLMAVQAARLALERAEVDPGELDLILYSGSMHKDFYVWSAANRIQYLLNATRAYAFEDGLEILRDTVKMSRSIRTISTRALRHPRATF